jgi:hypothetical protein
MFFPKDCGLYVYFCLMFGGLLFRQHPNCRSNDGGSDGVIGSLEHASAPGVFSLLPNVSAVFCFERRWSIIIADILSEKVGLGRD